MEHLTMNCFYFQSVLVETQDKALRRISELREQCGLEQSAKVIFIHIINITKKMYIKLCGGT